MVFSDSCLALVHHECVCVFVCVCVWATVSVCASAKCVFRDALKCIVCLMNV